MTLIVCPECNKEISDSIKTCIHCGYKIKRTKHQRMNPAYNKTKGKKKTFIIIFLMTLLIGGISFGTYYYIENNYTLEKAIEDFANGDYEHYSSQMEKLNESEIQQFNDYIVQLVDDKVVEYNNNIIEYDVVFSLISNAESFLQANSIAEKLDLLNTLQESKTVYNEGIDFEEIEDFEAAIKQYELVVPEDINHSDAILRIDKIRKERVKYYVDLAAENASNMKFGEAINNIYKAQIFKPNSPELDLVVKRYKKRKDEQLFYIKTESCPLKIEQTYLGHNVIGVPTVSLSVKNDSNKTIDAFTFNCYMYDNFNNRVNHYARDSNIFSCIYQDTIKPSESTKASHNEWIAHGFDSTTKYIAFITEIHFSNNTVWSLNSDTLAIAQESADRNIE